MTTLKIILGAVMSENNQVIQDCIGEVPDKIGTFAGVEITQELDKNTLLALIHWLIQDGEKAKKRHKDHVQFLTDIRRVA
jgi:hypothetical protein